MKRREFVWMIAGVAVAPTPFFGQQNATHPLPPPAAPVPWTLGLNANTPVPATSDEDAVAQTVLRFFTAAQFAALVRLSALLMPALNGKPGAVDAETPAFLDFLIGDSPASRKGLYANGLGWLDTESRRKNGVIFEKATDAQADAVVRPWLRAWMTDHPPTDAPASFINVAHADIRTATMNSRAWHEALVREGRKEDGMQMYWSPVDPDESSEGFLGGVHGRPSPSLPAPASEHMAKSYPASK